MREEMNEEVFWKLIKQSKRGTEDCDEQAEKLTALLIKLDSKEIIAFERLLKKRCNEAYRWDLWAVGYLINGGCSDDGFEYFRGWLIAQGKEYFGASLQNAEHAAKRVSDGDEAECEAILNVAHDAYRDKTGTEMPDLKTTGLKKPKGKSWQEDDLEKLYPKLWKRFFS
jgi:hypothetical protein